MAVRQELPWWRMAALFCALIFLGQSVEAGNEAAEARMRKDVTFLASDECEGRGVTTKGINLAADYIANEFKKAGLKPAGVDGTYFQPFTMSGGSRLESPNTLVLRGPLGQEIELRQGVHFQVVGMSATGKVNAPVVFAGYGATSNGGSQSNLQAVDPARTFGGQSTKAAEKKKVSYDDFQGMDVAGKLVVILRRTPRAGNAKVPFDGPYMDYHAALNTKIGNAEAHNAAGILFVNDQGMAGADDRLMDFGYTAFESNSKLPAVHIRRSVANTMLQSSLGKTLTELEADIAHEFKPQSAALAGWTASLETNVRRVRTPVKNIIAMVEGSGPLAKEIVVLGAHYDHLGYGGFGSLARNLKGKAIHHGADDNGSGTTMIMELARRFAQKEHQGRRLVFMAFSGEESGLLGSAYYCRNPVFPPGRHGRHGQHGHGRPAAPG